MLEADAIPANRISILIRRHTVEWPRIVNKDERKKMPAAWIEWQVSI